MWPLPIQLLATMVALSIPLSRYATCVGAGDEARPGRGAPRHRGAEPAEDVRTWRRRVRGAMVNVLELNLELRKRYGEPAGSAT